MTFSFSALEAGYACHSSLFDICGCFLVVMGTAFWCPYKYPVHVCQVLLLLFTILTLK